MEMFIQKLYANPDASQTGSCLCGHVMQSGPSLWTVSILAFTSLGISEELTHPLVPPEL